MAGIMRYVSVVVVIASSGGCISTGSGGNDRVDLALAAGEMAVAEFPPTCTDGVQDNDETDRDCGGSCRPCDDSSGCSRGTDCLSAVCGNKVCLAATCMDDVKNGGEADVDCGGTCPRRCAEAKACNDAPDCQSGRCINNRCGASLCADSAMDGEETDVDCGGTYCAPCRDGKHCADGADCTGKTCINTVCKTPVPRDGLVAEWLFDGDATDSSGNANHGTVFGAVLAADRNGNPSSAYSFNGKSAYIEAPNSSSLGLVDNFSISAWINAASFANKYSGIVSKYRTYTNGGSYMLRLSGINEVPPYDKLDFNESDGHVTSGTLVGLSPNRWHHVAAVMNAGVAQLFVDGILSYSGKPPRSRVITSDPVGIGIDYELAYGRFFDGLIDDVRIYNRVLTAQEIMALAQ